MDERGTLLARAVDVALEASVVGSWSRLGYLARRALFAWQDPAPASGPGTAVVTGGSSGLGLATAEALARLGWSVTIASRDEQRSAAALERLAAVALAAGRDPGALRAHTADLADLSDARRLAATLAGELASLDVLVHGAGALLRDFHRTEQGFEATFALQVLVPHVLTAGLLPALRAAGATQPARVITVSSGGMYTVRLDLAALEHATPASYRGARQYALAKRAEVELAVIWAERLAGSGVVPLVMHPGWVDTPALSAGLPRFAAALRPLLRTPAQGADTIVDLALSPGVDAHAGQLFLDRRPRARSVLPGTQPSDAERRAAFERVGELAGAQVPTSR